MGIVGREIAASRLLKQLVKSRMAGLRMSKGKAANSTSCSNKNGNVENGEKQREREGSVSKKEEPIYRIGQDRCLSFCTACTGCSNKVNRANRILKIRKLKLVYIKL